MKADKPTAAAVLATLQAYLDAIRSRDEAALLSHFTDDPDLVLFGSGADERRLGKDELLLQTRRDWSQSDALTLTITWSSVSAAGEVAWAATEVRVALQAGGESLIFPARFTAVLERRAGRWLIVQGHFSFPAGDQPAGNSFPGPG